VNGERTILKIFNRTTLTRLPALVASNSLLPGCFLAVLLIDIYIYRKGYNWPPIRSDGFGYYVYLPAIFIHHDIFFTFLNDQAFIEQVRGYYPFADWIWTGLTVQGDGFVDKYPIGTAIMQLPFFLAGWTAARLGSSGSLSGFEFPFQVASCISAAFYFFAALCILFRILTARIAPSTATLCLLFAVTTTNVLLYASYDGSSSHIYSFFLVSALCAVVASSNKSIGRAFTFGLLLGLAVMVRPTNIVAALLFAKLATYPGRPLLIELTARVTLLILGFVLAALPQVLIWLVTTGSPFYYSYRSEGFDFLHPHVLSYLFSVRKGVFFWHPAFLLMICALVPHYQKFRLEASLFLAMIALNLYLGSAWISWFLGGSFGARQTVDVLPVMVISTGSAFAVLETALPSFLALSRVVAIGLGLMNLGQMYGYMVNEIPSDGMTWDKYKSFWNQIPLVRAIEHSTRAAFPK